MAEEKSDTPVHDEVLADLEKAEEVDLTHFDEDDDPTSLAGDFEEDEEDWGHVE